MKIDGRIVSYQDRKKFGFIKGSDNTSYFFHKSNLDKKHKGREKDIRIGALVSFEPAAEPKGMAARRIEFIETYQALRIPAFKRYKNTKSIQGDIVKSTNVRTRFFKSPHDAKNRLKDMALESGANILFDESLSRETWSKGNYNYSMFQAKGTLAVITHKTAVLKEAEVEKSERKASEFSESFSVNIQNVIQQEEAVIEEQTSRGTFAAIFVLAFIVAVILMIF